jgi:hypothetical protein
MNLPNTEFLQLIHFPSAESSPKLKSVVLAWDHITTRFVNRLRENRILAGRIRSIRLLAVHDAIHSVTDPSAGHLFKEISAGTALEAALAAAAQAAHDVLAAVFTDPLDQSELDDLLEETLTLFGNEIEKAAGVQTGSRSAAVYVKAFAPLLRDHRADQKRPLAFSREAVASGFDRFGEWRRSA